MFTATLLDHNETIFTPFAAVRGTLVDAYSNNLSLKAVGGTFCTFAISPLCGIVGFKTFDF
jgi:hypothetical protein